MEWVAVADSLGLTPLNIILLGMLYFFGVKMRVFPRLWKGEDAEEETPQWAQSLTAYFNHDTTEHHEKTHEKLDRLIEMEEKEHLASQQMRDTLKDIGNTLSNLDRFGVKCRE